MRTVRRIHRTTLVMSKPARVAPRNIQFKNDVDVRQIPRNDEGANDGNDGQSWDPNLRNVPSTVVFFLGLRIDSSRL